jgi:hypothetical protein
MTKPKSSLHLILPLTALVLALPASVRAQFTFTTNNGAITITRYTGSGGAAVIPSSTNGYPVTSIGDNAFYYCTSLTNITIGTNVTSIGSGAFADCEGLTSVTIPNSVTSIGSNPFDLCTSLSAITVDTKNPVYSSLAGVLFNKSQTTLILYPGGKAGSYTIPNSVTNIGDLAFSYCTRLASLTVGTSVTSIGHYAFKDCFRLANVTLGNSVASIGDAAFSSCSSLTGVTIPNSVTSIGNYEFENCFSLRSVTIGSSAASIGDFAFDGCYGLTSITIPKGVTSIGYNPFYLCPSLSAITVDTDNPVYSSLDGVLFNKSQSTLLQCPGGKAGSYTVPRSVTSIGAAAFASCSSLTSVTIPNSVASIGNLAFEDCDGLLSVYFRGNAPSLGWNVFYRAPATVYYLPETTGWGTTFGGLPTAPGSPPVLVSQPTSQTAEAGSTVRFRVGAVGYPVPACQWCFNANLAIGGTTNGDLVLTNVQLSQAGAYLVVAINNFGAVTSAPVLLNVIAPVERRWVPGVTLMGQPGSTLSLDAADTLAPGSEWTTVWSLMLTSTAEWYFDLSSPLPGQRFFRARQISPASVVPALAVHRVPALALTGMIGSTVRVEGINQSGPTDAWFPLATVTSTDTSQLYFDVSAIGQPPRLWRILPGSQP